MHIAKMFVILIYRNNLSNQFSVTC